MPKHVIYGESNYAAIVRENGYFVDKTQYIARLEAIKNPVFLRPRRIGKSLFCSTLRYYYDLNYASHFAELFGQTWIGQHPTSSHNQYILLFFNFSVIDVGGSVTEIESSFRRHCNSTFSLLRTDYAAFLDQMPEILLDAPVSDNLNHLLNYVVANQLPPVYVIIDEYDNFANQLITGNRDLHYQELVAADGFLKTFFKTLKAGRESGAVANVFITGVLPITIDELASAYNIATFLTLEPGFEGMLGFTQAEVDHLLDEIYRDHALDPATRNEVNALIKSNYNGYHFVNPEGEALYNSGSLFYFLHNFSQDEEFPKSLIDPKLKEDLLWLRCLSSADARPIESLIDQIMANNRFGYGLVELFGFSQLFNPAFFPNVLFYLGLLTRKDHFYLQMPNRSAQQTYVEYSNSLSTPTTAAHPPGSSFSCGS